MRGESPQRTLRMDSTADERLSTRWTGFLRWGPSLCLGAVALVVLTSTFRGKLSVFEAVAFIAFLALANWRAWVWQVHLWDVWLLPGAIRIARGSRTEEISLSEVEAVDYSHWFGFAEIVLQPAPQGRRIILFAPRLFFLRWAQRPEAVETLAQAIATKQVAARHMKRSL